MASNYFISRMTGAEITSPTIEEDAAKILKEHVIEVDDNLFTEVMADAQKWDIYTRTLAATYYMIWGNMHKVEQYMAAVNRPVPVETMYNWRRKPWWPKLMAEVRKAKKDEFDALTTQAIHKGLGAIIDRLDNGEYTGKRDENGELERVPVKMKDAAVVTGIVYDKRALSRGDPTSKVERTSPEDSLKKLADAFTKMTKGTMIEAKKVETEYTVEQEPSQ